LQTILIMRFDALQSDIHEYSKPDVYLRVVCGLIPDG